MQKLQDSVFTLVKTTNLSPAVFSFLQPTDDLGDKTPLGGILKDTKHGWLALGHKFCVVDLRTGMKVAARTFGVTLSNNATVTSVVELPTPLTKNSQQLLISLQCDDISIIVVLNINGSQILRCIQTDVVVTELDICGNAPDGMFTCFDGVVIAGTKRGEIFAFDLNRATLIQALKDISQGYEHLIQNEMKPTNLSFLPLDAIHRINEQRELALENDHHLAVLLNENSFIEGQYIFRNPDCTVRMKAKRDHIRVTVLEYIPQTGSVAVGFNFGAFQIWNLMTLALEFTSQVNVECLPVTHFGFQEPCDDPRAFCYLWVIFSVIDRYEEEEFPLAVMYSLTYQGKRMLSDTKCLYQDFMSATVRFQVELSSVNEAPLLGGKCISCHTYSIKSTLGDEGEDSMLNLCQLVWECWAENTNSPMQYGMLLFDLDQWYKDQMPSTYRVESNAFLSASSWAETPGGGGSAALHARLDASSVAPYSHATRLEEHFYPNSLQYNCICLNTSEVCVLGTIGIQRQIISSMDEAGPTALLHPPRLYAACSACGLAPLYASTHSNTTQEDQRRYLLSVALEARLARFLKRCARDWATGSHGGVGCTLPFLVDWCWKRAIELKENAKELTAPLFISSALPDRNIVRCLEHCVQQLTQLTGLMDAILTKCCNLVVPDALSEMEEKHKGIGTVSLYFQVVQWFLRVGLLPERVDGSEALPYPAAQLYGIYNKRRLKLNRIQESGTPEQNSAHKSCRLLYIDQLLEQEFGGERIHQMWIKGGSECGGVYPPPSLYALLRLYLAPDIADEHKHSLVLYLLVDYSMIYDDVRYETVIRRLMQFPTMFGLSNTAIKATQAFWHLDHRDFDFALDQLQCLTGNTLSEWQHNVVLSSLLAQKKTQAALQYLHVRKPAPIQNVKDGDYTKVNDYDKLEDWQSCCNLYLARGLVYEALDVIRMCVQNAGSMIDKTQVLNMFFKGCRNTGNLSKIISVSFLPHEEEVFIKYLENCNESQTSDILIMYYLQQARYLEAERYNSKLRHTKPKSKDVNTSVESLFESTDRESARDNLVEAMCAALPSIAETVAHCAFDQRDLEWHVHPPKPMSVFVKAKSSQNTFTYKSSFIQDTIQNASEIWMNRPKIRKGLKRMLNIEETPFICTPKLSRTRSIFTDQQVGSTPPKRARLNLTGTPKTPRSTYKVSEKLSCQMDKLLDMPEVHSPVRVYDRPETPHSILKSRNSRIEAPSPCGSRYLEDTDDDLEMETASNHTHYSDSTNKHLRFTIPTPTEPGSEPTPSPTVDRNMPSFEREKERELSASIEREKELDISTAESYVTTASHVMNESNPLESPPKKLATEGNVAIKKAYKDSVRARQSLSISANSSLSDDPNTSIESIADIPITLINPRYTGNRRSHSIDRKSSTDKTEVQDIRLRYVGARQRRSMSIESNKGSEMETQRIEKDMSGKWTESVAQLEVPKIPSGRRGIRASGESTPLRSRSVTPDSPIITPLHRGRISRSRSKTPELSPRSSPLAPIPEQPKQEIESEFHVEMSTLSVPRTLRSRSRTPERLDRGVSESPKLEAIKESPTKSGADSPPASPSRSLRSRSRTPEVEINLETVMKPSPQSLRGRSKTPEKLMSPKKEHSVRTKKSLSRLVLEANTFAKTKQTLELLEAETASESRSSKVETKEVAIECTPMKTSKQVPSLMDVTLSPIVNKSILQSSSDSVLSGSVEKEPKDSSNPGANLTPLPAFPALQETCLEKSVLRSYQSSAADSSHSIEEKETRTESRTYQLPAFTTIHDDFSRSVLHSYESSAVTSQSIQDIETPKKDDTNVSKPFGETPINTNFGSVLHSHQSSMAGSTQSLNVSSLITDDSDVEMTETENQERAEQKEKDRIVEIVREINEIEDDMSNDGDKSASGDESSDESESSQSDVESSADSFATNDDVIAIQLSSDGSFSESDDSSRSDSGKSPPSASKILHKQVDRIIKNIKFTSDSESSLDQAESESDDSSQSKKIDSDDESSSDIHEKIDRDRIEHPKEIESTEPLKVGDILDQMEVPIDPLDQAQISLMTEDGSVIDEVTEPIEATNPLDQAQASLMTDDNSTVVEDIEITGPIKEPVKEAPQTDAVKKQVDLETLKQTQDKKQTEIESTEQTKQSKHMSEKQDQIVSSKLIEAKTHADKASEKGPSDPLAQVSLMTEDNSDQGLSLNNSGETIEPVVDMQKSQIPETEMIVQDIQTTEPMDIEVPTSPGVDVVDTSASETEVKEPDVVKVLKKDKNTEKIDTESQAVQETSKPETLISTSKPEIVKETLKPVDVKKTTKPDSVEETSKPETVKEACKPETVKQTLKQAVVKESTNSETVKEIYSPDAVKETSKPETVKQSSKSETVKQSSKSETVKQTLKHAVVKETTKPETVKEPSKPETLKETSKPETVKQSSKSETVKHSSKSETVKQTLKHAVVKETTKPETVKEPSKPETLKEPSNPETVKEPSKPETVKKPSKPETVKETLKPAVVKETNKTEAVKEILKPKSVKETLKPESVQDEPKPKTLQETPTIKTVNQPSETVTVTEVKENKIVEKMDIEFQSEQEPLKPKSDNIEKMEVAPESQSSEQETAKPIRTRKRVKSTSNSEIEPKEIEGPKTSTTRKRAQSRAKSTEIENPKQNIDIEEPTSSSTSEIEPKEIDEPKTPATRKRAQSKAKSIEVDSKEDTKEIDEPKTPSRKRTTKSSSKHETEIPVLEEQVIASSKTEMDTEEPKTPIARKRAQSTTSNKSEEITPENISPSSRKTTTEVRKMITRRMSREMRELDESNRSLDESITPKRRIRKNTDDNESVASGSSVGSSIQSGEFKLRRGRKSTVATKPDLSVIPEVIAEESREPSALDVINEYSEARRITRHQKLSLETSRGRRPSNASRASRSSLSEQDEEERRPAFDLQPIDRMSLLNKEVYDGPLDEDELQLSISPESIASDASKMRRSRMTRAASEAKAVVKAAKIHRRIASIDVPEQSPIGSPVLSATDSPARSRRASFTRAVEALHTPKGRRQSTDSKKSVSPSESPAASDADAPATPSRRGRRGSTQSNTSHTGRTRSKKMPVLEEAKEAEVKK